MLRRRAWAVAVFERGTTVAAEWRSGYDSLPFNPSAVLSHLPEDGAGELDGPLANERRAH